MFPTAKAPVVLSLPPPPSFQMVAERERERWWLRERYGQDMVIVMFLTATAPVLITCESPRPPIRSDPHPRDAAVRLGPCPADQSRTLAGHRAAPIPLPPPSVEAGGGHSISARAATVGEGGGYIHTYMRHSINSLGSAKASRLRKGTRSAASAKPPRPLRVSPGACSFSAGHSTVVRPPEAYAVG